MRQGEEEMMKILINSYYYHSAPLGGGGGGGVRIEKVYFTLFYQTDFVGWFRDFIRWSRKCIANVPPCPVPPQKTWSSRTFTLHNQYVNGHTDPLTFGVVLFY